VHHPSNTMAHQGPLWTGHWTLNSGTVYCSLFENSPRQGIEEFGSITFQRVTSTSRRQIIVLTPRFNTDIWGIEPEHSAYVEYGFSEYQGRFNTEGLIQMMLFTCRVSRDENMAVQYNIENTTSIKTIHLLFYIAGGGGDQGMLDRLEVSRNTYHELSAFFRF